MVLGNNNSNANNATNNTSATTNTTSTLRSPSLSRARSFKITLITLAFVSLWSLGKELRPVLRYHHQVEHIKKTSSNGDGSIAIVNKGYGDEGGGDADSDSIRYVQTFWKNFMVRVSPLDSPSDYTSYSYIATGRTGRGRLTFLHVPKTGGTSVEEVAARQNVSWGMCAFPRHKNIFEKYCPQYPPTLADPKQPSYGYGRGSDVWHLSRAYFPLAMMDPYHNSEFFMMVRDVYKRMISEFYHKCRHVKRRKRLSVCDPKRLQNDMVPYVNEVLQNRLTKFLQPIMQRNPKIEKHIRKQYYFAVGPHDVRMADYVLHLEESDTEFPQLMKAYDLYKIQFNIVSDIAGTKKVVKNTTTTTTNNNNTTTPAAVFGPEHLDAQTLKIMNDYYNDDFVSFNYSTILPQAV